MKLTGSVGSLLKNARSTARISEAARKIWMRVREPMDAAGIRQRQDRYTSSAEDFDSWAIGVNREVYAEINGFWEKQQRRVSEVLATIDLDLGGGGHGKLLYFLTRVLRPQTVVETGVAAGHSSRAILSALAVNGSGLLYSSDLPYMLVDNADNYIGVVVESTLRKPWNLHTDGDRANLPKIEAAVTQIDLFHYDSDKTVAGRTFALELLEPKFHANTVIIYDDIQDNGHFDHLVGRKSDAMQVLIFQFGSKSVGMLVPRSLNWTLPANG